MLHTIENDYLKVTVSDHGAELTSVYDKAQDFERIWCADPAVWNRHAPVLFPFVGKVKDGAYRYNGNTYAMKTQHGFARDAEFTCIEETTGSITHKLVYSDETLEIYPFEFELLITHRFDAENPRLLHVTWAVKNLGSDEMLYSIGGHQDSDCTGTCAERIFHRPAGCKSTTLSPARCSRFRTCRYEQELSIQRRR